MDKPSGAGAGCDLKRLFGALAEQLPQSEDDPTFALSADTLPSAPRSLQTDRLVIEKTYHAYDGHYRCDRLEIYGSKSTYCALGLLVASVLFSTQTADVDLLLVHPASAIRRLRIRRNAPEMDRPGFHLRPAVLNYSPTTLSKHPWFPFHGHPYDLPGFFLTDGEELVRSNEDWLMRDTIVGFGADNAMARLVELLLDASRDASETLEIDLEGEGGFRGVAPHSCEARFWLPGAFGWSGGIGPKIDE